MSFSEKVLVCVNCHKQFTFSVVEQESQIARGYPNNPQRCRPCRVARKSYRPADEDTSRISPRSSNFFH